MRKFEILLFTILTFLLFFTTLFFLLPQKLEATLVCGVTYPPFPPTWHNFEYESNCCIEID